MQYLSNVLLESSANTVNLFCIAVQTKAVSWHIGYHKEPTYSIHIAFGCYPDYEHALFLQCIESHGHDTFCYVTPDHHQMSDAVVLNSLCLWFTMEYMTHSSFQNQGTYLSCVCLYTISFLKCKFDMTCQTYILFIFLVGAIFIIMQTDIYYIHLCKGLLGPTSNLQCRGHFCCILTQSN